MSRAVAPVFDELGERAHGRTLRQERLQLVAMSEEEFELELSIRGVVFGPAGRKGFTIPRQRQGIDREEDEKVILAQGGDQGAFGEFEAESYGLAVKPGAERGDPRVDSLGRVRELEVFPLCRAGGLQAPVMLGIRPVEAHEGRKGVV